MYPITQKFSYFFLLTLISIALLSCSDDSTSPDIDNDEPEPETEAIITLNNDGASAYIIADVEGEGIDAETGQSNATITLETGGRYTFVNGAGASSHPLDFRNSDREKLFGQSNASGSFDNDDAVNVTSDGDVITFTLTNELADELFDYVCSFHPSMNGQFTIE